ncbi:MAG: helix-turn-helix transcriptional regulator [Paracoccaceae bacterium]
MSSKPYGLVCPISKATELLEPRWTVQILTEMWNGASRFNEIRRGVGWISPGLLSRRLKELERNGLVERVEDSATGNVDYLRTEMAIALEPVLDAMAHWAQRHIEAELALDRIDLSTLMWKIRRRINADQLPRRRILMRFHFSDEKLPHDTYWLLSTPGADVELCITELGQDTDLYVETSVHALGAVYAGRSSFDREIEKGEMFLSGDTRIVRTISQWLKPNDYALTEGTAMLTDKPA